MKRVYIQTLIVLSAPMPSILVLRPDEQDPHPGMNRVVPINIGSADATQIGLALRKAKFPRPVTHDLFIDTITNLDARIDSVIIERVEGSTFYATLVFNQLGRRIEIDARPSDAISLALRQDSPIYIEESVLNTASYPFIKRKGLSEEEEVSLFHSFIQDLSPDDFAE